ncbi:unnamed protein product [Dovyalis caffra]|uniref:Receptor-like serine/threonine-protein kinase n=1 Tax=Dovyalis caffra TaxID=77055 RepID=A0AAV1S238_9ROSI|nr:unnamed protein product [Dovyalis caffra]
MANKIFLLLLPLILSFSSSTSPSDSLSKGSSLSVENPNDVLTSPSGIFSAGFFPVGDNAYCFTIWFSKPFCDGNCTTVWMANRDQPVNGKQSSLSLLKSGNLVLTDAGRFTVWSTNTFSQSTVNLQLNDNGNLILYDLEASVILWKSFDFPTDTLLPEQPLIKDKKLVSSRSQSNFSSGFFKLYFDNDNVLRLLYDGPETSSIYWPDPELMSWEAGRSTYNSSRIAVFDSLGNFSSTDDFTSMSADNGVGIQRRLKIDFDGNLRLYSREDGRDTWVVSWQALSQPCRIHGTCGPNSYCSYVPDFGRKCSCLQGFKLNDHTDWSLGCETEFNLSCSKNDSGFLQLTNLEFFGYDYGFYPNYTLEMCEDLCLQTCGCKGFQFKFIKHDYPSNIPYCFLKTVLLNGHHSPNFEGDLYLKVQKSSLNSGTPAEEFRLDCSGAVVTQLGRRYAESHENGTIKAILWFVCAAGVVELFGVLLVWCFLIRNQNHTGASKQGYFFIDTGFRKFTHSELKKATRGFSEEIGRGGGGIVYKGILPDGRVAAIKQLNEANQGEAEFRAEVSIIGKLNHMHLIEMWGYCAEGKHRLLVYHYMEHGSLADKLSSDALDCEKRFDIAVGTARGLAYLHEECLEWVLHCDIKPRNILLGYNYQAKLSDFGLSRQLKRESQAGSSFSRIRGTRGYMAPEWVMNLPITSKVDVFSYGMVLLEMVTGMNPTEDMQNRGLVTWLREKMKEDNATDSWIEKMVDRNLKGKYDKDIGKMEILVRVALKCVNDDKDARPTMGEVVQMLLHHENGSVSI